MSDMTYTRLGQSALVVSRIALGTMTFNLGDDFFPGVAYVGEAEARNMVDCALDHGVHFFDAANVCAGQSETILGRALVGTRALPWLVIKNRRQAVLVATSSARQTSEGLKKALSFWVETRLRHQMPLPHPPSATRNGSRT